MALAPAAVKSAPARAIWTLRAPATAMMAMGRSLLWRGGRLRETRLMRWMRFMAPHRAGSRQRPHPSRHVMKSQDTTTSHCTIATPLPCLMVDGLVCARHLLLGKADAL